MGQDKHQKRGTGDPPGQRRGDGGFVPRFMDFRMGSIRYAQTGNRNGRP